MEKYIYILVAVIWFISGIYKAVKKGQEQQTSGKKPGRKKSVLETKLDEILREAQNEQQKKTRSQPVPVPSPVKEYRSEKHISQETIVDEAAMSSENMQAEAISMETILPYKNPVVEMQKLHEITPAETGKMTWNFFGSDLKSMVVFSEIIGKPKAFST